MNESSKNQGDKDELYSTAVDIIKSEGKASTFTSCCKLVIIVQLELLI